MLEARLFLVPLCLALAAPGRPTVPVDAGRDAKTYAAAIDKVNAEHARKPGKTLEDALGEELSKKARSAFDRVLACEDLAALELCADAALELALVEDFDALQARRAELMPESAAPLPVAFAAERFLLIGENGLTRDYLKHFARVFADILEAYDEVFGFDEFSKVPGKKLRVRVHLEEEMTSQPHFAPQFKWHSEIDFPVIDPERFSSPTPKGQFMFYGLCHELGHVIAMWGDRSKQEDHHAWAHYTGLRLVEHLNERKGRPPTWLTHATDYRWMSLTKEREQLQSVEPGLADREAVLSLLYRLDELVGPQAIGAAINALDTADRRTRINRVRYYTFEQLEEALQKAIKSKKQRKALKALFSSSP